MTEPKTLSEQKHEAILRAAVDEFQENGYQSTSMDRIAERAGVSRATVFWHFSEKASLFRESFSRLMAPFRASLDQDFSDVAGVKDRGVLNIGRFDGANGKTLLRSRHLSSIHESECLRVSHRADRRRSGLPQHQSHEVGTAMAAGVPFAGC